MADNMIVGWRVKFVSANSRVASFRVLSGNIYAYNGMAVFDNCKFVPLLT